MKKILYVTLFLLFAFSPVQGQDFSREDQRVKVRLVPEKAWIEPGTTTWIGVEFDIDKKWHIYWRNPGDSGMAITLDWKLPSHLKAGEIHWPFPKKFLISGNMANFGYEDRVLLLVPLRASNKLSGKEKATLKVRVDWLVCKEVCQAGHETLSTTLPIKTGPAPLQKEEKEAFQKARRDLPLSSDQWKITGSASTEYFIFRLTPIGKETPSLKEVFFFPYKQGLIDNGASQELLKKGNSYLLKVRRSSLKKQLPSRIQGLLVSPQGWDKKGVKKALRVKVSF